MGMFKNVIIRERCFDDIVTDPTLLAIVRGVLGKDIQVTNHSMIKDLVPGEKARKFHRDTDFFAVNWYPLEKPMVVNTLLAIDKFDMNTGGTRVVAGSHKWAGRPKQDPEFETIVMDPGSIVIFDGSVWHNNG